MCYVVDLCCIWNILCVVHQYFELPSTISHFSTSNFKIFTIKTIIKGYKLNAAMISILQLYVLLFLAGCLIGDVATAKKVEISYCIDFLRRQCDGTGCDLFDLCDGTFDACDCNSNPAYKRMNSDIPNYTSVTHECGYYDCKLPKLKFRNLKIFATCTQCFPGLKVHRVYEEFHGYDYGIEFSFEFGQHLQDYTENDWIVFQSRNITSNLSGVFRLIRDGEDRQYIQWSRLKVVP